MTLAEKLERLLAAEIAEQVYTEPYGTGVIKLRWDEPTLDIRGISERIARELCETLEEWTETDCSKSFP